MFWTCTGVAAVGLLLRLIQFSYRHYQGYSQLIWLFTSLFALWVASLYYIAWDSWRWEHPERWTHFWYVVGFWWIGFPYYFYKRRDWMEELDYRRHKPI